MTTASAEDLKSAQSSMRVGIRTASLAESRLRYIKQIGVTDVFLEHSSLDEEPGEFLDGSGENTRLPLHEDKIPTTAELLAARERVENAGLRLAGIHSLPYSLYGPIMFNTDECAARIQLVQELLGNLGEAGIPILGYQWNPRGLVQMRTSDSRDIRGNARATAFDLDELEDPFSVADTVDRAYTESEFWENYERFVDEVIPAAESADVKMALHPVDPPGIEQLGGIPRLFRDVSAFERAMDILPSDHHGLKLCLGCFSQIGEDIPALIRRFGERDQIIFVHFRDVVGTVPTFKETFIDEGNYEPIEAIRALAEVGFDGALLPDHVPIVEGDSQWGHRANAYTVGYLRALISMVNQER